MSFFKIQNLTTGYSDETAAIHAIHLEISKNEVCAIIGSNGAGKTTLLKAIMGILPNNTSKIVLDGEEIQNLSTEERSRLGIGYVPQGRMIFPQLTVEENLLLGVEVRKSQVKEAKEMGYSFFPALKEISNRKGGMLSGGQQQQLAIARMLVTKPKLLLLDEPAEGIQPNIVQDIGKILRQVSKEMDITVLLVEQFVAFALKNADVYYRMQGGEISNSNTVNESNYKEILDTITL